MEPEPAAPAGLPLRTPGPRCTICNHPHRTRIDALLVAGDRTYPELAREFAVSDDAVYRHSKGCLPARLARTQEALQAGSDKEFVRLAITQAANRLKRIQKRADQLEEVRAARAAQADPNVAGDHTGLVLKVHRSIRTAQREWRVVTDTAIDAALLMEERALERAAAIETGEWLAQTGKGQFGSGATGMGPMVVVIASGLQPLPGDAPGDARHRIQDPRRARLATAAEVEASAAIPLDRVDIEAAPTWSDASDTLEGALSGVAGDDDAPGPGVVADDDEPEP